LHHLKIRFLKVVAKDARDLVLCLIPAIETIMDGHATTSHTTTSDTSAFDNIEVVVSALQVYPPLFLQNIKRSQVSNDSIHTKIATATTSLPGNTCGWGTRASGTELRHPTL
jgi:hypothetical protein